MDASIHVQPSISVLSAEAIERIHSASLKILSEIGIRVDSPKAIKVFRKSREVNFLDDNHLAITPELVNWAIDECPSTIDIHNRKGGLLFRLGEEATKFGIGVTNLFFEDPKDHQILPFSRQHMRQSVGLGNQLNSFDVISTIGIIRDTKLEVSDLVAVLEMLANTIKPLVVLISDQAQFIPSLNLLERLAGDLITKPFAIPYFNPVTPLILNQSTSENMLATIERGLPLIFSNYGMAGMSTPITSAGTLALLNAELLAGLVYSQLIKPGTPVILGSLPAFFDMKTMQDFYDPQTMLLNLACAEMMAYYHIPHAGTSGSTNGWGSDLVAGEALMINQLSSCMGKVGLAPFVGGSFGSKVFSPLMTVFANEVIEQSRQFAKGFYIDNDALAFKEVMKAGVGGSFISSRQTMKLFREAYHTSSIFPRLSLEKWQELGKPDTAQYLRERSLDLLAHPIFPADQEELLHQGEYLITHLDLL